MQQRRVGDELVTVLIERLDHDQKRHLVAIREQALFIMGNILRQCGQSYDTISIAMCGASGEPITGCW